ncbi:HEAT repeat domain-containing protein [Spirillospora sp. NPDC046719]
MSELTVGWADEHLPAGADIEGWRREAARMQAADPKEEERRARAAGPVFDDFDEPLRMTTAALAAYDAVRAGLPTVHRLLSDPVPGVRATAAYLLGWFPEEAPASIPPLRALRDVETVPVVTANALISLGLLSDDGLIDRMRERLTDDEPLVRYGAAIALSRTGVTDTRVIAELATASAAHLRRTAPNSSGGIGRAAAATPVSSENRQRSAEGPSCNID